MAYGTVISASHDSADGRTLTVTLEEEGYAGSVYSSEVEFARPAYALSYDAGGEDVGSLTGSVYFTTGDSTLQGILSGMRFGSERDGRLTIKVGAAVVFQGYVLPDHISAPLNDQRTATVTISAKDRTRSLESEWLNGSSPYRGTIVASEIIADILATTGIPFTEIHATQTWRPGGLGFQADPYSLLIPARNFYEYRDDGTTLAPSQKQVLEELLGLTLNHLVQWDGKWFITQPSAHFSAESVTTWIYNASGVFQSSYTRDAYIDLSTSKWVHGTEEGRANPAFRRANVSYHFGDIDQQLQNGDFELWPSANSDPYAWTSQGNAFRIRSPFNTNFMAGLRGVESTAPSASDATRPLAQSINVAQTSSVYELSFGTGFSVFERTADGYDEYSGRYGRPSEIKTYYSVTIESGGINHRLQDDGTWTTGAEIKHEVDLSETGGSGRGSTRDSSNLRTISADIDGFPVTGELTVRIYEVVHTAINAIIEAGTTPVLVGAAIYDNVKLSVVDEEDEGAESITYGIYDSTKTEGHTYERTFVIGDGPFDSAPGAIKYADGTITGDWRPLANATSAFAVTELHAREFLRSHRNPQGTIQMTLALPDLSVTPITAILFDGKRYWPTKISIEQPSGRASILARQIRDDGVPSGRDVREDARVSISRGGEGSAIYADLNPRIQNAFTLLSSAQTSAVVREGIQHAIPITGVDSIFPAGTPITLVDSRTGNSFDLTVETNYGRFEPRIYIEAFDFDQNIDVGSYIIASQADALHRIAITENAYNRTMRAGRICALDGAVAATVTSLTVTPTRRDIAADEVLEIVEGLPGSIDNDEQTVQVTAHVPPGSTTIPIVSTRVDAPDGAHVKEDGQQIASWFQQNPDQIQLGVEREREGYNLTKLTTAVAASTPTTSLAVEALPSALDSGDKLVVANNRTGYSETVTLSAGAAASATTISVNSFTPIFNLPVGSTVRVADETFRSAITVNADNINLKVSKDDVINQINISTEGILIQGDNIQLTGDTTVDGTFTVGSTNLDSTVISGGKIITSLLTASNIQTGTLNASLVTVTNLNASNITTGTLDADSITIEASGTDLVIDVAGMTLSAGSKTVGNTIKFDDSLDGTIAGISCSYSGGQAIMNLDADDTVQIRVGSASVTNHHFDSDGLDIDGELLLRPITAPASTTNRLYNVGGNLFWNGTQIN